MPKREVKSTQRKDNYLQKVKVNFFVVMENEMDSNHKGNTTLKVFVEDRFPPN